MALTYTRHDFTGALTFPGNTLTVPDVKAGSCLVLSMTTAVSATRWLTAISDDVNGAWEAFGSSQDFNNVYRSWYGFINDCAAGTAVVTPVFNLSFTTTVSYELFVTEYENAQVVEDTIYTNPDNSDDQYASDAPGHDLTATQTALCLYGWSADVPSPVLYNNFVAFPNSVSGTSPSRNLQTIREDDNGAASAVRGHVSNTSTRQTGGSMLVLEPTTATGPPPVHPLSGFGSPLKRPGVIS